MELESLSKKELLKLRDNLKEEINEIKEERNDYIDSFCSSISWDEIDDCQNPYDSPFFDESEAEIKKCKQEIERIEKILFQ